MKAGRNKNLQGAWPMRRGSSAHHPLTCFLKENVLILHHQTRAAPRAAHRPGRWPWQQPTGHHLYNPFSMV